MAKWSVILLPLFFAIIGIRPLWADAPRWAVDPEKSALSFVFVQGDDVQEGRVEKFTADIELDPMRPAAGKVSVKIDMSSAETGDSIRDAALRQAEWFNVNAFPTAEFKVTSTRAITASEYVADVTLTIRDRTHTISLPFALSISGTDAEMKGELVIDQNDFYVGTGMFAAPTVVALEVRISVNIRATRIP